MRNVYALTLGDLPDRLAFKRLDLFAVEEEFQRLGLAVARSHLVAFRHHHDLAIKPGTLQLRLRAPLLFERFAFAACKTPEH